VLGSHGVWAQSVVADYSLVQCRWAVPESDFWLQVCSNVLVAVYGGRSPTVGGCLGGCEQQAGVMFKRVNTITSSRVGPGFQICAALTEFCERCSSGLRALGS
jgi:hypothetical protein